MNKFYTDSDYMRNRHNPNIVYTSLESGVSVTITLEMFLAENPHLTEVDFTCWKKWSDRNYRNLYRNNRKQGRNHLSLREELVQASRDLVNDDWTDVVEDQDTLHAAIQACLTKKQRRRLLLNLVHGFNCAEIAELEGVAAQVVSRSIAKSKKNLKKYLSGGFETPSQKAYR